MLKKIKNGEVEVLFHGIGTEPYWDVYILKNRMLYVLNDEKTIHQLKTTFKPDLKTQKIICTFNGKKQKIVITKEPGDDGMSDREFPYTVKFNGYNGAGDSRLMSDNWDVYLDGKPRLVLPPVFRSTLDGFIAREKNPLSFQIEAS